MAQTLPQVTERTLTICYEDLKNPDTDLQTLNGMLEFLFGGPYYKPYSGPRPGFSDAGGHATTKDADLRTRLTKVIHDIDRKYYDGDIAWLDQMLPCKSRSARERGKETR